jgi:hypothetical protein
MDGKLDKNIAYSSGADAHSASATIISFPSHKTYNDVVSFDRHELRVIMNVYGRKVAAGEWRDYALNFSPSKAIFSIYRRSSEHALFRIEKDPKLARKQGQYAVISWTGHILKRGQELDRVIAILDRD